MSDALMQAAIAAIQRGELVGMPTETVYGLAADAQNVEAVLRIFLAKGRPRFDPLIVHVADAEQAWRIAEPDRNARLVAEACWPGPLTLVLPRRPGLPDAVCSGLPSVALRCPDHPLALELIRGSGRAVAAPSANRFGRLSPTRAADVREQLGDAVSVVLDGGPCRVGIESTVLRCGAEPVILRPGGVPRERLAELLQRELPVQSQLESSAELAPEAPGMLQQHYAPAVPLRLRESDAAWPADADVGLLSFRGTDLPPGAPAVVLSGSGDLMQAAARLFAALRALQALGVREIVAELLPETGLGLAVNDRLRRAAGRR